MLPTSVTRVGLLATFDSPNPGIFALPFHRGNGGRSYHAPGNGGPCRLDVLKPTPPQLPKNQIHLAGHQAAVGKAPWCGGACLAGRPPICASSAVLSPHVQVVVHSGPLLTVIWWSHSPALRQCRPVHFLWLVQKPGVDFQ